MKRIMVIGCCGAGKTTFALKLHDILGIEVIHLDQNYHLPNWEEPPKEEWNQKVKELVKGEEWIIDGNYSSSMDIRINRADTIIYLKYSTLSCLYRVLKRTLKYHGSSRPKMAEGCKERFNLGFLHYVATFNMTRGRILEKKLTKITDSKKAITLENDKEVEMYLQDLRTKKARLNNSMGTDSAHSTNGGII